MLQAGLGARPDEQRVRGHAIRHGRGVKHLALGMGRDGRRDTWDRLRLRCRAAAGEAERRDQHHQNHSLQELHRTLLLLLR